MMTNKTIIIAECGVNHNGDMKLAREMIDVAHKAGADYVKFQAYKTEALVRRDAPMAEYQANNLGSNQSQFDMLKNYELSKEQFTELYNYAAEVGVKFLCTPFDSESLDFLCDLDLDIVKLSSGDLTNAPLILRAVKKGRKLILSTGMADIETIEKTLALVRWGWHHPQNTPDNFEQVMNYSQGADYSDIHDKIYVLHCLSDYPANPALINLQAMKTLSQRWGIKVGFSDHSLGTHISVAAVALGACMIEKHFTMDRKLPGPDHKASLLPAELEDMVTQIRDVESAIGDGIKIPRGNEPITARLVRKGLYIKDRILKGTIIKPEDIDVMRPESPETQPYSYWDIVGKPADRDYEAGQTL